MTDAITSLVEHIRNCAHVYDSGYPDPQTTVARDEICGECAAEVVAARDALIARLCGALERLMDYHVGHTLSGYCEWCDNKGPHLATCEWDQARAVLAEAREGSERE